MLPTGTESGGSLQEENALEEAPAPEITETETNEEPKDESVRETVARALETEKAKSAPTGDEDPQGEAPKPSAAAPEKQVKKTKKAPETEDSRPPERFNAKQKEIFNSAPPEIKHALSAMVLDQEREFTKAMQEARKYEAHNKGIVEAVQPYVDDWAERGFTVPQALAALAAANKKLLDPKTRVAAYRKLGAEMGITSADTPEGEAVPAEMPDIENHPVVKTLLTELSELKSERDRERSEKQNATVSSIVTELATVRDEKDASGRYRYPKLHDDGFLDQVKPLVSALKGAIPGISYGEALKRAYASYEGEPQGNSVQPNQARLPVNNSTQNRALQAAVSVRGRAAPSTNGTSLPDVIPDSVRETVKMALGQLRRG